MDNDEFLLLLQAQLDEAKSKGLINADIEALQKKINTLKLKAEIDKDALSKIVEQFKKVTGQDVVINDIKINTGQLEKTRKKIQQALSIDNTIDKQVIDLMKQFGIAGSKGSKAFNEIRNAIVNYRKELLSAQNLTGEFNDPLDIFGNSADINKVTSAIANNIKVANDGKRVYEDLAKYISAINASGSKIHLPNSIKSEYGENFSAMRSSLGSAFTTGNGTDFETFVSELNSELGNVIDLSHGAEAAFGDLVDKVRTTKEGNFLSGDELFSQGILDKNEVESSINSALENIEAKEMEFAQISSSVASNVVRAEEQKQQAIKETNDAYQALAENESIIKSGAGITTFSGIKEAQEHFQNLLKDEQAIIATTEKFDENNQLNSFTINVKRASGEVETLRYALDTLKDKDGNITNTFFKLSGSSIGDAGAIKQAQQIENAFSDLTQKIAEFKSTNNQILSGLSIPLSEFETKLDGLKNGTYTITEVTNAFKNLKTEAANITKNFSAQLSSIDRAVRELSVGEQTIAGLKAEIQGLGDAPREINDELVRCTDLLNNVKRIESESGRTEEWSAAYREWEESLDSIRAKLRTIKKEQPNIASDIQVENTITRLNNQLAKNSRYSKDAKDKIKAWIDELERGDVAAARLREINTEARTLHSNMSSLNKSGLTFIDSIKSKLGTLSSYLSASVLLGSFTQAFRSAVSNVRQLDDSLLELSKVSDLSSAGLKDITNRAYDLGEQVGKTGTQVIDAITTFKRAGFDLEQSVSLAEDALKMTNVAEGINDASTSAQYLISIMKGYRDTSSEFSTKILDAINEVSNTQAVDFDNLADGAQRLSAVANQAGVSFEQMLGVLTGGYEVLGNMEKTASGLITIFTRLQSIQLADEEDVESVAKLQESFSSATHGVVNIVDQTTGQLRSAYDILSDLSKVWDTLDKNTQEGLAFAAGGTRQKSVFLSIMANWESVEKSIQSATDSMGSAAVENEKYLDSISGKVSQFNSAVEQLSKTVIESDTVKFFVDLGTTGVKSIDSIVNALTPLGTLLTAGGLFAGIKNIGRAKMYALIYLF